MIEINPRDILLSLILSITYPVGNTRSNIGNMEITERKQNNCKTNIVVVRNIIPIIHVSMKKIQSLDTKDSGGFSL